MHLLVIAFIWAVAGVFALWYGVTHFYTAFIAHWCPAMAFGSFLASFGFYIKWLRSRVRGHGRQG